MEKIAFRTHIGLLSHLPGMHYVFIPAEVVLKAGGLMGRRFVCTVNGKEKWQCGFMALGEGNAYISITNKRMKTMKIEEGSFVDIVLEEDKSKYGMDVSMELEAVFADDPEGLERFENLTAGKQRYVIQYVQAVKNTDKRIERALMLIGNLKKLPRGNESFREMLGLPRERE
jgi:hypothetical protein